jgi:hypothetical protein
VRNAAGEPHDEQSTGGASVDGPVTDEVGTELLFENEVVRVWLMRLEPGASSPTHRHRCDYVIAYSNTLQAEILRDDLRTRSHFALGYSAYVAVGSSGSEVQRLTNVGNERHCHFVIELLGKNELASSSSNERASDVV